ncbi:DNA gyrase inhibitor YacG [Sphingomonas abietis]|uniref:DNA gyrase inhibitor YacG n=1 Tax=Sphingomonas abietis TaxID=3012344 RepID=A0ABY7NN76_9SPHN|nr:DNA gyrase inhibitor YacG [Sphingomonas abietis]WBO22430.1 DNA gyrase inhibitor YacG [Sphingomonas abietis]
MSNPDLIPPAPIRRAERCPVCGKPVIAAHAPFCGQGCRDRDLLQWLGEGYRVPGAALPTDEED